MPELSLALEFHSQEMNSLDLPVTIRKPNSALVRRVRSSEKVDLPPGDYFVTAVLPAGQEITRSVQIGNQPASVTLSPDPEDASPHEWDEERLFLSPSRVLRSSRALSNWPAPPRLEPIQGGTSLGLRVTHAGLLPGRAYVRTFTGNPLRRTASIVPAISLLVPDLESVGWLSYFRVESTLPAPLVIQILEVGVPALNLVVPNQSRLAVSRRTGGETSEGSRFKLEVLTNSPNANLQLRYSLQGSYQRAAQTAATAENLLASKVEDPLAAAVGAYSLLRIGQLERLHDWTANLENWFPWLPDGSAIHGEHRARLGDHVAAVAAFNRLVDRGLPFVSDGLFYAVGRLKLYASLPAGQAGGIDVRHARELLARLQRFASVVHPNRPTTTFPGLDSSRLDASALRAGARLKGVFEVVGMQLTADFTPSPVQAPEVEIPEQGVAGR